MTDGERDHVDEMARLVAPAWTEHTNATLVIRKECECVRTYWLHCSIIDLPAGEIRWLPKSL